MIKKIALYILVNFSIAISFFILASLLNISWQFALLCCIINVLLSLIYLYITPFYTQIQYHLQPNKNILVTNLVTELCQQATLSTLPKICLYQSPTLNIFTLGRNKKTATIILSTGALNYLTLEQLKAILAHEIAHITSHDMSTMMLLQASVSVFTTVLATIPLYFINLGLKLTGFKEKRKQRISMLTYTMLNTVLCFSLTIWGRLFVNVFSRSRQFRADKISAKWVGHENMIGALKRLQDAMQFEDDKLSHLAVFHISRRPRWFRIFSTHPLLEQRIQALETR